MQQVLYLSVMVTLGTLLLLSQVNAFREVSVYIKEDMVDSVEDIVHLLRPIKAKTPAGGVLYVDEDNLICAVIYGQGLYHEKAKVYYRRKLDTEHLCNMPCHYGKCKEV